MKITKSYLKQVIKEELGHMEEVETRPASSNGSSSEVIHLKRIIEKLLTQFDTGMIDDNELVRDLERLGFL